MFTLAKGANTRVRKCHFGWRGPSGRSSKKLVTIHRPWSTLVTFILAGKPFSPRVRNVTWPAQTHKIISFNLRYPSSLFCDFLIWGLSESERWSQESCLYSVAFTRALHWCIAHHTVHTLHTFAGNLHQTHLLLRIHLPMHPQEWGFGSEAKQCFRAEFSNTRAQEPCTLRVFGCRQISADTRAHFKCFANSCQHICPDICTDWPTTGHLVVSWSCLKITLSQVFRALPWSNWVSTSINWGLLLGWPAWAGWEPWRTLVFDQGWRWCFSIQPWSRPQSMATPSTIFNGDLGPPPNWILSRVAWRQLKCVRWQHRIGHSTFGELPQPMLTSGHSTLCGMPQR